MSLNELSLAQRYQSLSKEYAHRPVVARRNTVPALLKLLGSADRQVRIVAAETLALLSDHPENPEFLCHEKDFLLTIFNEFQKSETEDEEMHSILGLVFDRLRVCLEQESQQSADGDGINAARADGESSRIAKGRSTRVLKGVGRCRYVTLEVQSEGSMNVRDVQEVLHTIRGIVSFTVDTAVNQVTLYTSTSTQAITNIMQDGGFSVTVVAETTPAAVDKENMNQSSSFLQSSSTPGYVNSFRAFASSIYNNTLVLHGVDSNTLAARLKQQKEEAMRKKTQKEKFQINQFLTKLTAGWW